MKLKYRRKPEVVEAEQNAKGDWTVFLRHDHFMCMSNEEFQERYEEVSPQHRVSALHVDPVGDREGSD